MTPDDISTGWRTESIEKLSFVAVSLPVLGVIGGLVRVIGASDQVALLLVVPVFVAFFCWRRYFVTADLRSSLSEREMWTARDTRLRKGLQAQIDAQQEELRDVRRRQEAEQQKLLSQRASSEQLQRMMKRHRDEYEGLLKRQSA